MRRLQSTLGCLPAKSKKGRISAGQCLLLRCACLQTCAYLSPCLCADQARAKAAGQNQSQRKSTANWVKQHCTTHLAGESACHICRTHSCQGSWSEVALCCQCQGTIRFCLRTHLFNKLYTKQDGLKCWCWDFCRHAEAITLLLAVIREAPNLPDAYHTLGLLYESQGDAKKALDFHMISAHLSKVWSLHVVAIAATTMLFGSIAQHLIRSCHNLHGMLIKLTGWTACRIVKSGSALPRCPLTWGICGRPSIASRM